MHKHQDRLAGSLSHDWGGNASLSVCKAGFPETGQPFTAPTMPEIRYLWKKT